MKNTECLAGVICLAAVAGLFVVAVTVAEETGEPVYKSPLDVAFSPDGRFAYVVNQTADSLSVIDTGAGKVVKEIPVGAEPSALAVAPDGKTVFVANTLAHSISFVDPAGGTVVAEVKCGYEPVGLCASPDGKTLYSANYISDDVSILDVATRKETGRIKVGRSPKSMAITPDGKTLVVCNFLSRQPATEETVSAFFSVIDTATGKVIGEKRTSTVMLMGEGLAVSPDGRYAYCVHLRPNANVATTQLNQGWIQTNALSVIPLADPNEKVVTLLLDNVHSGAANPSAVAISKDGKTLFVAHRGIHKLSVLDLAKLHGAIKGIPAHLLVRTQATIGFLWSKGVIRRVDCGGLGPQAIAVSPVDGRLYVANYFSDSVAVLDAGATRITGQIPLGPDVPMTVQRKGEFLFTSAAHCFQQWLSCKSCHPRVRVDGLNWDLLNDGMTNPKNAKSLVGSAETPPSMWRGVREKMEVGVEKGFLFIEFHTPSQEEIDAVSAYLRAEPYIQSPWHRNPDGTLDEKANRGRQVFKKAKCSRCHPAPLYTNLKMYDVGTLSQRDFERRETFDTPSLIELYRTAPYLHDGRASTIEETVTKFNEDDLHGNTSKLNPEEIQDLVAFLMTL